MESSLKLSPKLFVNHNSEFKVKIISNDDLAAECIQVSASQGNL